MSSSTPNNSLSTNPGSTGTIPVRSVPEISAATFFSWVTASQRLEEWVRWMPYVCRDSSETCDLPSFPEFFRDHGELPWPCGALGEDGDDGSLSLATAVLVRNAAWIHRSVEAATVPLTILAPDLRIDCPAIYEPSNRPETRTWTGGLLPPAHPFPTAHETAAYWYIGLTNVIRSVQPAAAMSHLQRDAGDSARPPQPSWYFSQAAR